MNGAEMLEDTNTLNAGHCPNYRPVLHLDTVAVLFARSDSHYKTLPACEVYDMERDARTYDGPWPVVAHPPCRAWGRLRTFAKQRPDERNLARLAVALVREFGGVLEHPAGSTLWSAQSLPTPGKRDAFGGWTLAAPQKWWGHKAEKETWFYVVGCEPRDHPELPLVLGEATHVVQTRKREDYRPHITKAEREHTPPELAAWLVELARRCKARTAPPMLERMLQHNQKPDLAEVFGEPCEFCGHKFRAAMLGRYGCPNCGGEGLDDELQNTEAQRAAVGGPTGAQS